MLVTEPKTCTCWTGTLSKGYSLPYLFTCYLELVSQSVAQGYLVFVILLPQPLLVAGIQMIPAEPKDGTHTYNPSSWEVEAG